MVAPLLVSLVAGIPSPLPPLGVDASAPLRVAQAEEDDEREAPAPRLPRRPGRSALRLDPRKARPATPRTDRPPPPPAATPAPPTRTPPGPPTRTPPASTARTSSAASAPTSPGDAPTAGEGIDFSERAKKGKFNFEFSKAEIVDVVKAISNLMRRNFIIPEKLKSQRITILSPTKISAAEAYQVFLAALEVNNITVVRSGKFYKLVASKDAIKSPIPTCVGDEEGCPRFSELMITIILPLQHVEVSQINPVVKSLVSKDGEITMFQPSNALIISEYAPNLARVRKIIAALDVPGFDDELHIIPIEFAVASEISDKLTQVFDVQAPGRGKTKKPTQPVRPHAGAKAATPAAAEGGEGGDVRISKIVPDDRTNMLIIKANRRAFAAIRRLIEKLDIPTEGSEGVHVVYLENADAEGLSSTLSSLAQGQQAGKPRRPGQSGAAPTAAESAVLFEGEVKITADKSTNSLIIVGSRHDFKAIQLLIEQLDVPRRQVYVEAAILEVNVSTDDEFGLNWHAPIRFARSDIPGDLGGPGSLGFVQSAQAGGTSPTLTALTDPTALLGVAGGSVVGIMGKAQTFNVGDSQLSLPAFGVILRALQSSSNAQVLSTPHILTTDNEEASIEVGQKIPFRRGTSIPSYGNLGSLGTAAGSQNINQLASSLSGLNSGLFSAVDRIDVSLKLTLTPQINERDKVRLEIEQQIEDVVGQDEATQTPITANRSAKTVVVVDDQQTIVLGGLMRDRTTDSESKIPILGDLPVIGWLFKQRSSNVEKVSLLLVLTPYIIRDRNDFQRIFERKLEEHEEFAAEFYGHERRFRAHIDYARKSGPLAKLAVTIRNEKAKYENGGDGDGSETLIRPEESRLDVREPEDGDAIVVPRELDRRVSSGDAEYDGGDGGEQPAPDTREAITETPPGSTDLRAGAEE